MVRAPLVILGLLWLAPRPARAQAAPELTAEEKAAVAQLEAQEEVVTIVEEAPAREQFAPDTERRLSGKDLAERGVTTVAEALRLIPEITLLAGGKGDTRVQIRGGRKGSVMMLIDGVPANEAYYGTFDPASLPITDILEIRVSLSPASPLEGPGGSSGVIEIVTLPALGKQRIGAAVMASSVPSTMVSLTGRQALTNRFGLRFSGGFQTDDRELFVNLPAGGQATLRSGGRFGYGSMAAQYDLGKGRLAAQLWAGHRIFTTPPGDSPGAQVLHVDGESVAGANARADYDLSGWLLSAQAYHQLVSRNYDRFADASLTVLGGRETLSANASGARGRVTHALSGSVDVIGMAALDTQAGKDVSEVGVPGGGRVYLSELAAGLDWKVVPSLVVRTAAGAALPFSDGDSPWPEAKVNATWTPGDRLQVVLVGARKGRVPTLRERYGAIEGNPAIRPEMTTSGELGGKAKLHALLALRANGYVRLTEGFIRFNDARTLQVNYGDMLVEGAEAGVDLAPERAIGGGATYNHATAQMVAGGEELLQNLPSHRVDAWIKAAYRDRMGVWLLGRYVGERVDMSRTLSPYFQVEASAWARITRELRATLRAGNALDEIYRERADTYGPGRSVSLQLDGLWE
jgi:outer membrane receptor protein involved in Fe transport